MNGNLDSAIHLREPKAVSDAGVPTVVLHPSEDGMLGGNASDLDDVTEYTDEGQGDDDDAGPSQRNVNSELHEDAKASPQHTPTQSKTRRRIRSLEQDAKQKAKHAFKAVKARAGFAEPTPDDSPYADLDNNPAFDPSHLVGKRRLTAGGTADKILGTVNKIGSAIAGPQKAAKRKAASTAAVEDRPYLSHEADNEFLDAHADLDQAHSDNNVDGSDDEAAMLDLEETRGRVQKLETIRDGRKVAWVTSHHIHRVLVVPKRSPSPLNKDDFYVYNETTGQRSFDWQAYFLSFNRGLLKDFALNNMGDVNPSGQEPFSKDIMLRFAERILIASSPWQSWFFSMRKIYRWEDPKVTAKWAAIWFFIWWIDFPMTFCLAWVAYIVLQNKFSKQHVHNLRESHERARTDQAALRFNELIKKHGSANWLDPLLEEAGPLIQMQLADTADFLEILANFFDWRWPAKTWATLFWFACAIVVGLGAPRDITVKVVWMFSLLSFFLGRPIASKHPEYRHTVNALKWIFWSIPTDAEWSMMYLRQRAQETRARLIGDAVEEKYHEAKHGHSPGETLPMDPIATKTIVESEGSIEPGEPDGGDDGVSWHTADSSTSVLDGHDLVNFRCRYKGMPGRLIIYSNGLRFQRSSPFAALRREMWRYSWLELLEMRKEKFSTVAKVMSMEGLVLVVSETAPGPTTDGDSSANNYEPPERDGSRRGWLRGHFHGPVTHDIDPAKHAEIDQDSRVIKLEALEGRDRAFNCILGFSGLRFQVLQPLQPQAAKASYKKDKVKQKTKEGMDGQWGMEPGMNDDPEENERTLERNRSWFG